MNEKMAPRTFLLNSDEEGASTQPPTERVCQNRGKKVFHVVTKEGHTLAMGMAIADVIEALMSVTKICDTGRLRKMAVSSRATKAAKRQSS